MTHDWSTCFTRAERHLKAASDHMLLGRKVQAVKELTKTFQWLSEALVSIWGT